MGHLDTLYLPEIFVFYQKEKWLINCLKFAPNAPEKKNCRIYSNPILFVTKILLLFRKQAIDNS